MLAGSDLRAKREAAGLSLSRMAQRTHFARSYLSMIETGKRPVADDVVAAYEQVLGVPLALNPGDPLRVAHEWLVNDSPVAVHTRSGRKVSESLASELEQRVIELRHLDDVVSCRDLLPAITKELGEAEQLVSTASFKEPVGRRLFVAVGELSQLAGWVASDAGEYARAQRFYMSGVGAAREARDRVLGSQLLSSLSYQIANIGDPAEAALLARTAVMGAESATPAVRALLLERVAWASARARETDATWRALDAVDDSFEQRGDGEPEWVYWLNRNEIDVMAGRCMIELGRPNDAEPLLANAIANYPPEHAREVALYLTWLAESHARAGDLDAARQAIQRARSYAETVSSARTDLRLEAVQRLV
ncbi:helix-turn-helix transcriptional regulator [Saccharopolyspora sp. WRP15-2]|uniref:Helix-turn-helix transcriptional regulator n=1 Tax=Saccharopolyspora oryzae TaxID=2997343 RepID=A0ABT4UR90_9PSEU|nr:helix-turn-helix transcriptional regulator [Saccharopolyspora oryzae]MDA3624235.1 helix-turn-helix transcriptional regulator [Saccharopolyspora oryzae]